MSRIENWEKDLKNAYLNYQNKDMGETLKCLDNMVKEIVENNKVLNNDPFWMELTGSVFKGVVLNNFYNNKELMLKDFGTLLTNEEEMKRNISEFCNNFRNNELINFIKNIENIESNPLKSAMEAMMYGISQMNMESLDVEGSNSQNSEIMELSQKIENVCEVWNRLKNELPEGREFFEETEKQAISELIHAKNIASIRGKKLADYNIADEELNCSNIQTQLIISYFGLMSVYDKKFTNDGGVPCEEMSIDNVGLFRAVLMIYIVSFLDSITGNGIPLNLKFTFERQEFVDLLAPLLKTYLPKIFSDVREVRIFHK